MEKKKIVMPLKDAIKKAVKENDTFLDFNQITQQVSIYGICANNWPAGREVINGKAEGYFIDDMFTIEREVWKWRSDAPRFIRDLDRAINADCGTIDCDECPLRINGSCIAPKINNNIIMVWGDINAASEI